jgi:hypothetical protein
MQSWSTCSVPLYYPSGRVTAVAVQLPVQAKQFDSIKRFDLI